MKKHVTGRRAAAMALSAATLLLWTPIAGADDPQSQCAPDDQQCQDQEKLKQGTDAAQQATDQAKQAADQAKQADDQAKQGQKAIDLSEKHQSGKRRRQCAQGLWPLGSRRHVRRRGQ